ncbi:MULTISPECIES: sulfur carrier protein ThiS [Clostridium]|uniref:sulfur carrier protein ThiS n=1 Tax=Clostridium TaxID=1485 RepID=UPI00069F84A6|nr:MULTISPECIES: sulfur carrier protein ThiS [Clostridium]KOF57678.1 sulfur transfer protein involved in thiamine biosynthesis [Clostridium sp. DMHC 10]MCD2347030.1 sulfur carrier protein ThiS [Clostridium guangxiense]
MILEINGSKKEVKDNLTVSEILVEENVEMPDMVTVQLNGEFLDREEFSKTTLKENDQVDFLYFMGGGSFGF